MKRLAGIAALVAFLLPSYALGEDLGIDGTTIIRFEERSTPGFDKQKIVPVTQYLGFDTEKIDGRDLSFHFFGWGRLDLADDSGESTSPDSLDGNFTYGYLQYRFAKANASVKAGRFFVYEGVASEQIDGLYGRTDLKHGFTIAAFAGVPVKPDGSNSAAGDAIGGGRLGYRYGGIMDIGLSGLYESNAPAYAPSIKDDRQMVAGDLWLSPHQLFDISGRSSYNATTEEVAEHSYMLTVRPVAGLTTALNYSDVRLAHYFTFTNVPSLFNPVNDNNYRSLGLSANYRTAALGVPADVTFDWKHYSRLTTGSTLLGTAGDSDRLGINALATLRENLKVGVGYARTDAADGMVSFDEARLYALYTAGRMSANVDMITNKYDDDVYGKSAAYEVKGGAGYQVTPSLRISGELSYADNPWYDSDFKGLARLTYSFTNVKGAAQ